MVLNLFIFYLNNTTDNILTYEHSKYISLLKHLNIMILNLYLFFHALSHDQIMLLMK